VVVVVVSSETLAQLINLQQHNTPVVAKITTIMPKCAIAVTATVIIVFKG